MAKHRDIISYYLNHFPKIRSDFLSARETLERNLDDTRNNHIQEIERIRDNYESFENNHAIEYRQQEDDYLAAVSLINEEYEDIFSKIDSDLSHQRAVFDGRTKAETEQFKSIMASIDNLRQDAYSKYLELTDAINKKIDHEMKVHIDFINQEDAVLANIHKEYQERNAQQANRLLWTIEQSRNALETLAKELHSTSMNEVTFMNESILKIIESLRETGNRITVLFKSTSDLFLKQKDKIENLNLERQKPHSQLNQIIIRQYVKQIRDVNHKRTVFDQMVKTELEKSLLVLGQRIVDYDASNDKLETEKAILQYEIAQEKADYLLHKNQAMSDLLISKYQNEIKKIKIDSFKRVEEIKLAYYMPAAFYQNSVNLYSNFAFYTRESFNELDGLLSSLLEYNNQLADTKNAYISLSTKTVEDYKLKVMVHVNSVTSKLTDLVSKIDELSKKIITLESNNQLEIAEIRKKMESVDITGDYQKYIAGLDNDEYFACYQHDINMQKIRSEHTYQENLLLVEKSANQIHKDKSVLNSSIRHLLALAASEKNIRDLTFDKELALFYAQHALMVSEQATKEKLEKLTLEYYFSKHANLLARGYEHLRKTNDLEMQAGSETVVDYVHKTQKLIDLNESDADMIKRRITVNESEREYAYYLEKSREKIIRQIESLSAQKVQKSEQALVLYKNHFYSTIFAIQRLFDNHLYSLKRSLLRLDRNNANAQAADFTDKNGFLRLVCENIDKAFTLAEASLLQLRPQFNLETVASLRKQYLSRYSILSARSLKLLKRTSGKSRKTYAILETFYVESIKLIDGILSSMRKIIDSAEIDITRDDVLFIERNNQQRNKTVRIINREFDRLVYDAVKTGKRKNRQIKTITKRAEVLNNILKDKVKLVNDAYLSQVHASKAKLEFIKRELANMISDNEKALRMQLRTDRKRYESERKIMKKRQSNFLKVYQMFKKHSEYLYQHETDFIEKSTLSKLADYDQALITLDKKVIQLPEDTRALSKQLETEKMALVEKRNHSMHDQLTAIESQKFIARPKFIETIEAIRKRLPSDYLELYRQIQTAENDFLSQFHNTDLVFAKDFKDFLRDQTKYTEVLNNDLPLKPFDSFLKFQEYIYEKTDLVFLETIDKSNQTKKMIADEEQRMKDKEKRIIG